MRLAPIVISALALLGCATSWHRPSVNGTSDTPSTAYVCIDLPPENVASAERAVAMWDRALAQWRHLKPVVGGDSACTYYIHETTQLFPLDPEALAWASILGGREISLVKDRYEHDVSGIIMHELGHCLGAQHVTGTLMNPRWSPEEFRCPDVTTVAQVAAWNRVDLGSLAWCVR